MNAGEIHIPKDAVVVTRPDGTAIDDATSSDRKAHGTTTGEFSGGF